MIDPTDHDTLTHIADDIESSLDLGMQVGDCTVGYKRVSSSSPDQAMFGLEIYDDEGNIIRTGMLVCMIRLSPTSA